MLSATTANGWRTWRLRLAAVVLGMLPVLAGELSLRVLGLPKQPPPLDPFVDLHKLQPLFEFNPATERMEIGQRRMNLFRPASFVREKGEGTFRVFALGGSTTQGEPYSTETAFPEWFRLTLQASAPDTRFEVINCGGLSYASYRVRLILHEVLEYAPDLIVIYTGHNEYLERRSYADFREQNVAMRTASWLTDLRMVAYTRSLFGQHSRRKEQQPGDRTELESEVDALLDYQGGLEDYQRRASWYAPVPDHFAWNLRHMIEACQAADVPLIVARPVSNLLDCPPFKFEPDPNLSPSELQEFDRQWELAKSATEAPSAALQHLQKALEIDPAHAGANFLRGRVDYEQRDFEAAKISLTQAKDCDVCPLRAPTVIAETVSLLASQYDVPLLDAERLLAERSQHGIVGQTWLVDHIHPTVAGHQLLGEELAELCFDRGLVPVPEAEWLTRRRQLYEEHLATLGEVYFQRGKQRLAGLMLWTQGRAKKVREAPDAN
jgi:lysophospholipase L1-like esterase